MTRLKLALALFGAAVLLAGCGASSGPKVDVPGGTLSDVTVVYDHVALVCFVYDGDYAGNLECHRGEPAAGVERVEVPNNGHWKNFSLGRVRMIEIVRQHHALTCLEYDGDYKGSINCPDELNPR